MNEDAFKALRLAESYLDDAEKIAPTPNDITSNNGDEYLRLLNLTAKQLTKVSTLDVTLKELDKSNLSEDGSIYLTVVARELAYRGAAIGIGQGNTKEGVLLFAKAIEVSPKPEASFYAFHAAMLAELGKKDDALASIRKAISIEPDNIEYEKIENEIESHKTSFKGSTRALFSYGAVAVFGLLMLFKGFLGFGLLLIAIGGGLAYKLWTKETR